MPTVNISQHIDAPVEIVWGVLDDFGDIQRWNPGVTASGLTSPGPVGEGSTRHCSFRPMGGVEERIAIHEPSEHLRVEIYETHLLPISHAEVDFVLKPEEAGTMLSITCDYTPNLTGKVMGSYTDTQMRKGMAGLARGLSRECEDVVTS